MKILLIEPNVSGHHISLYLIPLIDSLLKKKNKITIIVSKLLKKNKNFRSLKKNSNIKFLFIDSYENDHRKNFLSLISKQVKYYYAFKRCFKKIKDKPDYIFINSFNTIDKIFPILGSPFQNTKISGFFSSIKFHLSQINSFQSQFKYFIDFYLFKKLISNNNITKIFTPDPLGIKFLKNKNFNNSNKVELTNDFGPTIKKNFSKKDKLRINFRKKLNILKDNYIILVYGFIRKEKCINYLINTIKNFKFSKNIKIIIAGEQANEIKLYLNEERKKNNLIKRNIVIFDKFISSELEKKLFIISDLVWTGYDKNYYGSSGVFFLSSLMNKPVLTSNHGLINWYNKRYKIGKSIDISSQTQVYETIQNFINKKIKIPKKNYAYVNKKHNYRQFCEKVTKSFT